MLRRLVIALVVLAGCAADDAADDAGTAVPPSTFPAGVAPVGFETEPLRVTNDDGTVCELCVYRAATAEQRGQGLMGVTDLGTADGMAFVFEAPVDHEFWMRNTPLPLDIAWFDTAGALVSTASMTPCLTGPDGDCDRYGAHGSYSLALELPAGRLAELGIGEGSVAELGVGPGCDTP